MLCSKNFFVTLQHKDKYNNRNEIKNYKEFDSALISNFPRSDMLPQCKHTHEFLKEAAVKRDDVEQIKTYINYDRRNSQQTNSFTKSDSTNSAQLNVVCNRRKHSH